ncbi:MAG TPA: aldehyde dehydrogenase family protein [Acidimicrobiales bacterium]|nr:aldehyde dehydrogenase family protein [Acidimicrobiales bacterium]
MTTTTKTYDLYIDGKWVAASSDEELETVNPATEEVIGRVPLASRDDVDRAVDAARRAFDEGPWPRMSPRQRSDVLLRFTQTVADRRSALVDLIIAEAGSARPIAEALQFDTPLRYTFWFAERAATFPFLDPLPPQVGPRGLGQGVILKEPVGVVAAITPFNFPLYLNLAKVAPALATGNAVVLKPSPYTPLEALVLGEIADDVGLPPGVLNIVTGDAPASERLTTHPSVDMVTFTGSDVVGRKIMGQAAEGLKKILLELGGKSPNIVFAGAPLDKAVASAATGFTIHAGQGCALPTRILAERSIYDEVVERLTAFLAKINVGDPTDPKVTMGPLIREAQRERVERYVAKGTAEGARLAFGGSRPASASRGYFYEPTLLADVASSMSVAQDEIFGPVAVAIPFDGEEEAVAVANDSRYGLAASIWHRDATRAYELARQVRAGTVTVNGGGGGTNPWGPFGGYKQSGIGREYGDYGLLEYTQLKTVSWSAGKP